MSHVLIFTRQLRDYLYCPLRTAQAFCNGASASSIFVVYSVELRERQPKFFYGFKVSYPEQVFLLGLDMPFSKASVF